MVCWGAGNRIRWLLIGVLYVLFSTCLWAEITSNNESEVTTNMVGTIALQAVLQDQSGYLTGKREVIFRIYDQKGGTSA